MKTPAALMPPRVEDRVRKVTARTLLHPENPTATRNTAGKSKPVEAQRYMNPFVFDSSQGFFLV